ncbi:alanine racemase [Tistlia consotensis]|uniref:Alanine racemase n=1 Tax=Tistlia consotensis USBA 355 TaxID=560819 RepID=A0A1Y6BAN8_9PROT|nr:alanine racemase [Tistlia consotensis]SMF00392.1 alanine racemase [Tistlia consotensis USBA 355]SNR75882.1 alanine racemase [Tistlia consotensis]
MSADSEAAAARPEHLAGGILTVDLGALQANYRRLVEEADGIAVAAVVKADAYGLGAERAAPALWQAGARIFFVALPDEALTLRRVLPAESEVYVLGGLFGAGAERDYLAAGIRPVLNSLQEIKRWGRLAAAEGRALPACLHVDTGMSRLGLPADELATLAAEPERLAGVSVAYLISHLASGDEPDHPLNREQLEAFRAARERLPAMKACLANSPGSFLGPAYRFDLLRPGAALYGVNPTPGQPNPMAQVVRLQGRILQVRVIDPPRSVGYGAAFRAERRTVVATVGLGYADGFLRSLSGRGRAWVEAREKGAAVAVPLVGRVSMDLITLDVTDLAEAPPVGSFVDLLGPGQDVDALAAAAGTIGYEVLTSLGGRYRRVYRHG